MIVKVSFRQIGRVRNNDENDIVQNGGKLICTNII